jgi:hypothetical protein
MAKLVNPDRPEWTAGNVNDRSVEGFRIRQGGSRGPMSPRFYNSMKQNGLGPRETIVLNKIIITAADEREWEEARANPTDTELEAVEKVRQRWHQRALKAGRASAASSRHVSKRGRRKK